MSSLCRRVQPAGLWSWQIKTWFRWNHIPNHMKPVATNTIPSFNTMVKYFYNFAGKLVEPSLIEYDNKHYTHFSAQKKTNITGIFKVIGSCNSSLHFDSPLLKNIDKYKMTSGFRFSHCNPCNPCGPCNPCDPCGSSRRDSSRDLTNKVAVITGGAEGIGYIIGDYYLMRKAKHVVLLDINVDVGCKNLRRLTKKFGCDKAAFMKCNVITDLNTVTDAIFCKHKRVDILVNNAGVLDEKKIKRVIDVNVASCIEWGRKYWEHMRTDKGGKGGTIINIASIYGFRVNQFLPTYQASKFAMMGFTKALGHEYNFKKYGVRVMAICPGFTPTTLTSKPRCWDKTAVPDFKVFLKGNDWQKLKTVGKAAVDAFEYGESGTAWLIEGGRPITEVVISHKHDRPIKA